MNNTECGQFTVAINTNRLTLLVLMVNFLNFCGPHFSIFYSQFLVDIAK